MLYRAEIDGLRAVAVATVVLYHAGSRLFSGGYIGVDIFFVISGFLITSIILADLNENRFSLKNFYERRCRRILPPLAFMAVVTTLCAWYFLLPRDFLAFGRSLAAMSTFWANIYFFKTSGYWDPEAETMPLLHTWSLSVEEQFYIVFPLLMLFLHRKCRRPMPLILASLAGASFVAAALHISHFQKAVFYLTHYRAWELLLGSVVAFLPPAPRVGRFYCSLLGITGLAAIFAPALLYTPETVFPGLAALAPCLGAALLIYINGPGQESGFSGRLLSVPPLVGLGKISYALYLWHWPIFVFYALIAGEPPTADKAVVLVSIAVGLSIISYRYIENPIRRKRRLITSGRIFAVSFLVIVTFVGTGRVIRHNDGFPDRLLANLSPEARLIYDSMIEEEDRIKSYQPGPPSAMSGPALEPFLLGAPGEKFDFVLWGDSHARAWTPAVDFMANQHGATGLRLTHTTCLPSFDLEKQPGDLLHFTPECRAANLFAREFIKRNGVKHVIIAFYSQVHLGIGGKFIPRFLSHPQLENNPYFRNLPNRMKEIEQRIGSTVRELTAAGVKVWVVEPVPVYSREVPTMLIWGEMKGLSRKTLEHTAEEYHQLSRPILSVLESADLSGLEILRISPPFCQGGICATGDDQGIFYRDSNHLSHYGALHFANTFLPLFTSYRLTRYE